MGWIVKEQGVEQLLLLTLETVQLEGDRAALRGQGLERG
jgi:hypothetical protein